MSHEDLCILGIFALQTISGSSLLKEKVLGRQVQTAMERSATDFVRILRRYIPAGRTTLHAEFGTDRSGDTLPHVAMQLLGRLLYRLADLPPLHDLHSEGLQGQFAFGKNWRQFVERGRLSAAGLLSAVQELRRCAGGFQRSFQGLRVLDLGCGSGVRKGS